MRRSFERRERIAQGVCSLTGVTAPHERAVVLRLVTRWDWRQARDEAAALGYVDIGGEAG